MHMDPNYKIIETLIFWTWRKSNHVVFPYILVLKTRLCNLAYVWHLHTISIKVRVSANLNIYKVSSVPRYRIRLDTGGVGTRVRCRYSVSVLGARV